MNFEVGRVIKFDNIVGEIISLKGTFMFLGSDLNNSIEVGDLVIFRPEIVQGIKRAFFVSNLEIFLKNNKENEMIKKKIKEIINS